MLETVEMRWFFADPPLDVSSHFQEHTELQERTDWYSMPCNPLCGIKVREGKLEAKLRLDAHGVRDLRPLAGHLESYRKWSLEFPPDDHPTEDELRSVDWLAVLKRRRLRRFEITADGFQPVPLRPVNGCEFEMTELIVDQRSFWTVGFEAVGPYAQLEDNLQQTAAEMVRRGGLLQPFTSANSFGYAQWLSEFHDEST